MMTHWTRHSIRTYIQCIRTVESIYHILRFSVGGLRCKDTVALIYRIKHFSVCRCTVWNNDYNVIRCVFNTRKQLGMKHTLKAKGHEKVTIPLNLYQVQNKKITSYISCVFYSLMYKGCHPNKHLHIAKYTSKDRNKSSNIYSLLYLFMKVEDSFFRNTKQISNLVLEKSYILLSATWQEAQLNRKNA